MKVAPIPRQLSVTAVLCLGLFVSSAARAEDYWELAMFPKSAVTQIDVTAAEMGLSRDPNVNDVSEVFRAVDRLCQSRNAGAAFPNFHRGTRDGKTTYGVYLIGKEWAVFRDVPSTELGKTDTPLARMQGAHNYARAQGFATGIPTFNQAVIGGKLVFGVKLLKRPPSQADVRMMQIKPSDLPQGWNKTGDEPTELQSIFRKSTVWLARSEFNGLYAAPLPVGLVDLPAITGRPASVWPPYYSLNNAKVTPGKPVLDPVGDQGRENSCLAWATCSALSSMVMRDWYKVNVGAGTAEVEVFADLNLTMFDARAFYAMRADTSKDAGWNYDDALEVATKKTIPFRLLPNYGVRIIPGGYKEITDKEQMREEIAKWQRPLLARFDVPDNFVDVSRRNGVYLKADVNRFSGNMGHAVMVVGYNNPRTGQEGVPSWECQNSWGRQYGKNGYFFMEEGICKLDASMWVIYNYGICDTNGRMLDLKQRNIAMALAMPVIAYADDNGWEGHGANWIVRSGAYSNKGIGKSAVNTTIAQAPFKNDEIRSLIVPQGVTVYLTDDDTFRPGGRGALTITGPFQGNLKDRSTKGLEGKVSSMAVGVQQNGTWIWNP